MSLDCVEMSLGKVFESGQAYVALSRARSLQGLRVLGFSGACVRADPTVISYYQRMSLTPDAAASEETDSYQVAEHF